MPNSRRRIKTSRRTRNELILDLGPEISLTLRHGTGLTQAMDIGHLVANFQDAVNEPQTTYQVKDYCGENYFVRKSGMGSRELYRLTQEGNVEGAEWFVEYGAHVGSLIANLETLLKPSRILLTGPLSTCFDAWSHSMGKARKQHLGERPQLSVEVMEKQAPATKRSRPTRLNKKSRKSAKTKTKKAK